MESCRIIRQVVENLPEGPILVKAPRKIPAGEAVSRYEAPRGEDIHYVCSNGSEKPERVKVRAPTLANVQAITKMMENSYLADVPIVLAAIDPCFSCTDRAVVVHDTDGERRQFDWNALRIFGIEWYRKNRGVDFSKSRQHISGK
jgi:NADH-quinone oxidoreductase subunit D